MTATNLLTNHTQAFAIDSGLWSDSGGGPGSAQDSNAPIGTENRARRVDANDRGFSIGKGTLDLSAAGMHLGMWVRSFQPTLTNFIKLKLGGSATGPDNNPRSEFNFAGSLYPKKGQWIRLWLDVARTADLTSGTLSLSTVNWVGANFDMGNVSGTSPNTHIARIDYGTAGIEISGAGGDFAQAEALDLANNLEIYSAGVLNGPLRIKNGTFSDTNFSIKAGDQPLAASDWIKIEIDNTDAGNSVVLGNYFLEGFPVTVTGTTGTIDLGTGTMLDMPAMTWNSAVTFAGSLVASAPLDAGGADLSGATFDGATGAHAVAVDSLALVSGANFVSAGTGHGVDRGTISANTSENWDATGSGYDVGATGSPVTTTSTGNELIRVNVASGVTWTINIVGAGTVPSIKNDGPGDVVINLSLPVTVTVVDANGSPLAGVRVRAVRSDTKAAVIDNLTTNASGQVSSSFSGATPQSIEGWARDYDLVGGDYTAGEITGTIEAGVGFSQTIKMEIE